MTSNAIIFQIGAIVMKKKQIHAGLSPLITSDPQSSSPHSRPLCLSVLQRHSLHPLFSSYDSLLACAASPLQYIRDVACASATS
jgi:hypothetical protein